MPGGLLTDLYELNMAASYLRREMDASATFSLYVRGLPAERGFLVAAGLEPCLAFLESFSFDGDDLDYLTSIGFDERAVEDFRRLRFDGEVWAVPEGRIVHADEPLLEVTAPIAVAQLVETYLLNQVTLHTTLASKAARYVVAAEGRGLVDFAFRRTHGADAADAVARASAMVGFAATSNVHAARRHGLKRCRHDGAFVRGSVPHRGRGLPRVRPGPPRANDVPGRHVRHGTGRPERHRDDPGRSGSRATSACGSTAATSIGWRARRGGCSTRRGSTRARIFASGGLDEHEVAELVAAGAPIDAFGIGTQLGVSADAPYVDTVYKLVEYDGRPTMKLSAGKVSAPGRKQVWRRASGDLIAHRDEPAPAGRRAPPRAGHERRASGPSDAPSLDDDPGALPSRPRRGPPRQPSGSETPTQVVVPSLRCAARSCTERTREEALRRS